MDYWKAHTYVVERFEEFSRDVEANRLVKQAESANHLSSSWFARKMLDLSAWMISTGGRLRQRYADSDSHTVLNGI